jgi:hypothetical protein
MARNPRPAAAFSLELRGQQATSALKLELGVRSKSDLLCARRPLSVGSATVFEQLAFPPRVDSTSS